MRPTLLPRILFILTLTVLMSLSPLSKSSQAAPAAKAALLVTPVSVIPGAYAVAEGTNFVPGAKVEVTISVKLESGSTQTNKSTATPDKKGTFKAQLHVPKNAVAGKFSVTAKDTAGHTASAFLIVAVLQPSVVVVPTLAIPGTPITVVGFGYSAGASITITLGPRSLGTVTTSADGHFKTTLTVPADLGTSTYTLKAAERNGHQASVQLRVFRRITTQFYFASLYTGAGYQESLLFVNTSEIKAQVQITYQRTTGAPRMKTISVPAHSRFTENVNSDLGTGVSASAVIATDVPIAAERMMFHNADGAIDPGTTQPSRTWYFTNGNTTHGYQEYIAIQNPTHAAVQATVHLYPTHGRPSTVSRSMPAESRTTVRVSQYVHDAVGMVVTASGPVVANRTEYVHDGVSSKTGVTGSARQWYFASGQRNPSGGPGNRHWIGVINTTGSWSQLTLHAYAPNGEELGTVRKALRPYARDGFLMNQVAGRTDVAVAVSTSQPSIVEQLTFLNYNHDGNTDTYGVDSPQKSAEFAAVSTSPGQDNLLSLFNPNLAPIPVVVQFLNAQGGREEQSVVIPALAHTIVDVGHVVPNAQLGVLVASNDLFVALDRQVISGGRGAMTTIGTQP